MPSPKKEVDICYPYAWEDLRYLFRFRTECVSELVNIILFVYLASILAGAIIGYLVNIPSFSLFAGIIATIGLIPTFVKLNTIKESFINPNASEEKEDKEESFGEVQTQLESSLIREGRNPFHNVLIDEYPTPTKMASKTQAPPITSIDKKVELDEYFRTQWYSDPTDVFGKTQSQRMFITQPSTTIPNQQDNYQDWLYKIPGKTCKEGNGDACYGGSDGGVLPWANI